MRRMLTQPKHYTWLAKLGAFWGGGGGTERDKDPTGPNSCFQVPCYWDRTSIKHVHMGPLSQKIY